VGLYRTAQRAHAAADGWSAGPAPAMVLRPPWCRVRH